MTGSETTLVFADPGAAAALHLTGEVTPEPTTTVEPSGVPTMRPDLEVTDVSPGLEGFLAIFAVVIVAIFLMLSMTKKLRKVNHRAGVETTASATFGDDVPPAGGAPSGASTGTADAPRDGTRGSGTDGV